MREKLIELLCTAPFCTTTLGKHFYKSVVDKIADYLLDNGVVVLPEKVYQTDGVRIYESRVTKVVYKMGNIDFIDFDDDAIGTTIFFTREEAEKALERSKQ